MEKRLDQKERDLALTTLFEKQFFRNYTKDTHKFTKLEIIVTPECNLNCEYCYINNYRDKLYPKNIRDHDTILKNLDILLNWIQENEYYIKDFDIFSGEFFVGNLGFQVLDKIYNQLLKRKFCDFIVIPTNFYFISSDRLTEKVIFNLERFKKINTEIILSCSIDGKYVDESARISKSDYRTDEYYDKVFQFCKKYHCGFHPMVSIDFINNYEKCYSWWIDNIVKLCGKDDAKNHKPMFLEVRNDGWDQETLQKYSDFLWFAFKTDLEKLFNNDLEEMVDYLMPEKGSNNNLRIPGKVARITCSIQANPIIRLGDLAIVPCHRTSYDDLIYGNFKVENDKIVGIQERNYPLATTIYSMNPNVSHPKCSGCIIREICLRGCLGSQLEVNKDPFLPIESVCNLMFTKFSTLKEIFNYYDVWSILKDRYPESYYLCERILNKL